MRKSLLKVLPSAKSLIVVGLLVYPCIAQAQANSDVTVYGRLVQGIKYLSNQNTGRIDSDGNAVTSDEWSIDGSVWGTNKLGFIASKILDGRMLVWFNQEYGFEGGSDLRPRRSLIGLSGNFGTLKLGRNLSLPSDVVWYLDSGGQQGMGTATLVKGRNWPINKNQVDYITPNFGGFTAQGVYDLAAEGTTGGISLAYVQTSYELRAMYDVAKDADGQFSSLFQYSKELTLGGTVTFDKLKLFFGYQNLSAPAVMSGPDKANHFWLGATYRIAPALELLGGAYHVKLNQNDGTANLFMLGANYYLSDSGILVYASIGTVRNGAQTNFAVVTGDGVAGQNQLAFYSGISCTF